MNNAPAIFIDLMTSILKEHLEYNQFKVTQFNEIFFSKYYKKSVFVLKKEKENKKCFVISKKYFIEINLISRLLYY